DLDFGDAVAQHLYLLLGMGERSLARLERFSETVAALLERGARLLEFTRLAIERIAGGRESLDHLLGAVSGDWRFHRLSLQRPDLLGSRDQTLAPLREQFLRSRRTRTQGLEPQIRCIGLGLMPLIGLVARGGEGGALVLSRRQADIHLLWPCTRGSRRNLDLG